MLQITIREFSPVSTGAPAQAPSGHRQLAAEALLLGAALRRKGKDEGVEEQDMEVTVQAHNGMRLLFSNAPERAVFMGQSQQHSPGPGRATDVLWGPHCDLKTHKAPSASGFCGRKLPQSSMHACSERGADTHAACAAVPGSLLTPCPGLQP